MKFLISGSARRVGYADGERFVYTNVDEEPRQWHSTGIGMYAYAMLHAEDMIEVEAETIDDAVERGWEEVNYGHALMLLNFIINPKRLKFDDEITGWFLDRYETSAKPRVNAILRQAPLPSGVTIEALKAAIVEQPRLAEALGVIIEAHGGEEPKTA